MTSNTPDLSDELVLALNEQLNQGFITSFDIVAPYKALVRLLEDNDVEIEISQSGYTVSFIYLAH